MHSSPLPSMFENAFEWSDELSSLVPYHLPERTITRNKFGRAFHSENRLLLLVGWVLGMVMEDD